MLDLAATIDAMKVSGMSPEAILVALACVKVTGGEPRDEQAARRREKDRERKARLRNSAESADIVETDPPSSPSSPTPLSSLSSTPTTLKENPPKGGQKKASRLPSDWTLPDEWRADALTAGLPPQRIDLEAAKMRDWSVNSAKGAKIDWRAAWRNWCREAADRTGIRGSPMQSQPTLSAAFGQLARNMDAADVSAHHPQPSGIVVLDVPFRPRS